MRPVLLIDADVFAYKAAAGAEKIITFDDEWCFPLCSLIDAEQAWWQQLYTILEYFDVSVDDCIFCFSTDHNGGFRRDVLPTYKANRDGKPRPVALKFLRERLMGQVLKPESVYIRMGLEADDCLGILSTYTGYKKNRDKIIVSVDKDMRTIPAKFFNANHPEDDVMENSLHDADLWFMKQTLMGDSTDGYSGCPGVGPKKADQILEGCETEADMWSAVVKAYEKAGLNEDVALQQARVARILRADDYDFENRKVKLWKPKSMM